MKRVEFRDRFEQKRAGAELDNNDDFKIFYSMTLYVLKNEINASAVQKL